MQTGTFLIVDDNKSVLTSLELLLEDEFERVETASNPNSILSVLDTMPVDLVILDMNFSAGVNTGNEGLFWLRRIQEIAPELPVIMLTAYGDVELAVKALKSGAVDFILKPWDNEVLLEKVHAALQAVEREKVKQKTDRPPCGTSHDHRPLRRYDETDQGRDQGCQNGCEHPYHRRERYR